MRQAAQAWLYSSLKAKGSKWTNNLRVQPYLMHGCKWLSLLGLATAPPRRDAVEFWAYTKFRQT